MRKDVNKIPLEKWFHGGRGSGSKVLLGPRIIMGLNAKKIRPFPGEQTKLFKERNNDA